MNIIKRRISKLAVLVAIVSTVLLAGCSSASFQEYQTVEEAYPNAEIVVYNRAVRSTFYVRTKNGAVIRVVVDGGEIIQTDTVFAAITNL